MVAIQKMIVTVLLANKVIDWSIDCECSIQD